MYDDDNFIYDDDDMFDDDKAYYEAILEQEEELHEIVNKELSEADFAFIEPDVLKEICDFKHFLESFLEDETEIQIHFDILNLYANIVFETPYLLIDDELKNEFDIHFQKADEVEITGKTDGNVQYAFVYDNPFVFYKKSSD